MGKTRDLGFLKNIFAIDSNSVTNYVPTARTLTINGTTHDLSANRSFTIATSATLGGLTDATISTLVDNQILRYNAGTNKWVNWTPNYLTGITSSQVTTALGYTPSANTHTHAFADLTSKPTTLSGYGITDAASSSHNHNGSYWPVEGGWKPASLSGSTRLIGKTSPDGGEFALAYSGGQIHAYTDGFFYQNEGQYRVIDTNSIGSSKADGALKLWASSHPNDYYIVNNWTGSYWQLTTNHGSGVQVAYANSSGNADTTDGYHVSVGGSANTIPTRNASGYLIPENWIQLNGHYGLYSGTNNAHFYPNNNSYGSWKSLGERNGWRGLHFGEGTGMTLMMNETEFGFHREAHGWYARFTSGRFYGACDNVYNINYALGNEHYWTAIQYFQTNNHGYSGSTNSAKLQAYSTGNNSAFMSFHKSGNYAVNMGLDADNVFRIGGWSASANRFQMDMSGNLTMAGDITAYSDARVKENVETVDNALDKVLALRGVYYNRIDSDDKRRKLGVIAQETLEVVPEVVNKDNDGMYNVSYGNLGGLFIEAFKEHDKIIKDQALEIKRLNEIINGLTK